MIGSSINLAGGIDSNNLGRGKQHDTNVAGGLEAGDDDTDWSDNVTPRLARSSIEDGQDVF